MSPLRQNFRQFFFILLLLLVSDSFLGLIQPFLLAVFWAIVLNITFQRVFRIMRWKLGGRGNLAAVLMLLGILSLVIIPATLILFALVDQGQEVYHRIETGQWDAAAIVDFFEEQAPRTEAWLSELGITPERMREDITNFARNAAEVIASSAFRYTQNAIGLTAQFFLMFYLLFFFLRDGRRITRQMVKVIPMGDKREYALIGRFTSVVRATLRGTVIVAVVQGSLGGILFAGVGIDGALFWGILMTFFAFLPVGGSGLVWGPAAIILLIQGQIWQGIVIILVGSLLIGLVDNLLRPLLVGRDTKMPDYLILLSTLGGIAWFGLSGFVLGPVIAALFLTCWEMAGHEYGGQEK
ncbi:MAG: AI-2E family transporter [Lewinella sp.]|nr:AI-2E family transporter [Lewinella sp.]